MKHNIFITGFSGTGKTTVGRQVAGILGWQFVDLDDEIVAESGKSIAAIFDDHGEIHFRGIEAKCLSRVCKNNRQIVATGGGIITSASNRTLMAKEGIIVCLEARIDTIVERLENETQDPGAPPIRPMLNTASQGSRIRDLKKERQFDYSNARFTIHTDGLMPIEVAQDVVSSWRKMEQQVSPSSGPDLAATVSTSTGDYPVWVGLGIIREVGERIRGILQPSVAYVIADEAVYGYARRLQVSMEAADVPTHLFFVPSGEINKTLDMANHIYRWLACRKAERGDMILAVGGGVVGDLAGFVAATYLRGMPYAHIPTSLLAMMDAAIGGKTAVDLPQGKNLVGAFYQPRFVVVDVETLGTLSERELISGWAEAIKHGLILDKELLSIFENNVKRLTSLDLDLATEVIRRSVAIKANVVSQDEKETLGLRVLLNYGHTIGHAIEAATSYRRYLHGEAVSIGMIGAAHISRHIGMMPPEDAIRQRDLLASYGLPTSCYGLDSDSIRQAMLSDKKMSKGSIRWVLLNRIGEATTHSNIPAELIKDAVSAITSSTEVNY